MYDMAQGPILSSDPPYHAVMNHYYKRKVSDVSRSAVVPLSVAAARVVWLRYPLPSIVASDRTDGPSREAVCSRCSAWRLVRLSNP